MPTSEACRYGVIVVTHVLILARRKHSTAADQPRLLRNAGRVWRRSQEVGDEASSQLQQSAPVLNGLARPIPDRHAEEVQRIVADASGGLSVGHQRRNSPIAFHLCEFVRSKRL
jgi:hypothetical protein